MSKTKRKPATAARSNEIVLNDEGIVKLRFKVAGQPDELVDVDILLLRMAAEKCEGEHNLKVKDNYFVPTTKFFKALAREYTEVVEREVTVSHAAEIWPTVNARWFVLKKNTNVTPN